MTDTWFSLFLGPPILAVGHSYGGLVLGAAVEHLRPASVVYVDAPSRQRGGWAPDGVRHEYASDKAARTYDGLRERRPHYSHRDCLVEARAAKLFDVETAVGLAAGPGGDWTPSAPPRSLMVRPDPSMCVPDEDAELLRARDVEVRHIPGAEHSVWYSHFDAFMSAIADR